MSDLLSELRRQNETGHPLSGANVTSYNAALDDVREALLSDETVKAVLSAQRTHVIKSVGYTDTSGTTTTNSIIWTGWKCLGCATPIDSQREADEHPIRMGLAALTGGDR